MKGLGISSRRAIFVLLMGLGFGLVSLPTMAQNYVAATSSTCDLGDITDDIDLARSNPEWAPINLNGNPLPNNEPNILEGWVLPVPSNENQDSQASAEVSEEELPWNHYTHDYTFKVVPDSNYQYLLSSWTRFPGVTFDDPGDPFGICASYGGTYDPSTLKCTVPPETCPGTQDSSGANCHHEWMEVEWENGSRMKVNDDDDRLWGALPEYAWPAVGDRVWAEGRWIFDCGHAGLSKIEKAVSDPQDYVKFDSEIHPPRALATFRLNRTALASEPSRSSSLESSWLPVTGELLDVPPYLPPTLIPVTQADIFVSGNGGGANDICSIVQRSDSTGDCSPYQHSGPVIPVNDRNYVFDIYPPGTDYGSLENKGTFKITPPVPDASLQWRVVDQSIELPTHTCGPDKTYCVTVDPIICPIDNTTAPPTQNEKTTCPDAPAQPTRLRVILPFAGSSANYFSKSILLGWDDVPAAGAPHIRTFHVKLNQLYVNEDGRCCTDADWRVFLNVGGQWRYISPQFDTDKGIYEFNGGDNVCKGDPMDDLADDDCYDFTKTPWTVNVVDSTPIHVGVGGFDSSGVDANFCRNYSGQDCDPGFDNYFDLAFENDPRIGTYQFDILDSDYAAPPQHTIHETKEEYQYTTTFSVDEVDTGTPPVSDALQIGDPHYGSYVSSATPFTLSSSSPDAQGFQYRFHLQGGALPTYTSSLSFPVHWANASFSSGHSLSVYLNGASAMGDGTYDFQYSANSTANLLEPRHDTTTILDNTPPVATITQPTATQHGHSDTLTLNYSVSDGSGSGVKSFTPKMDGQTASQFCAASNPNCLDSGQPIYLISMSLGTHTFSVDSVDNVNNAGTNSVIFTITVTFDSLKGDVNDLVSLGCIDNISQSLISKISAAQNLNGKGQTQAAINTLSALINEIQAQAGKHISTTCTDPSGRPFNPVQLLIGDTQYLQGTLGQLKPNPVIGSVLNSNNVGINGVTVNLVNSSKTVIATAATDSAGFFYFADTSGFTVGANYTVKVTLPKGYKSSTPASQAFTWKAVGVTLSNFVLN